MLRQLLSVAALAATSSAQMMNLTAALMGAPDLSNLTTLVSANQQLLRSLSMATNITILAPSNEAFAKVASSASMSMNNTMAIQALLSYHVLNGTYSAAQIMDTPSFVPTMLTDTMYANVTGGQVVQGVRVGENVTFYSGLLANSTVTQPDTNFTGGVIHVIDTLLTIPMNVSSTAVEAGLSGVVGLLEQTELTEALDTAEDITLFAPNNEAFQKIGSALPNLTVEQVAGILQYHVVNGTVGYSSSLTNGSMLTAMDGNELRVTIDGSNIFVNSAKVVIPDVLVANGVVHVIDNVLNPNMTMATPVATATSQAVAFSGASSASELPFTSGVPTPTTMIGGGVGAATSMMAATATSSSSSGAAVPMKTGAIGAAALFAGANVWMNV